MADPLSIASGSIAVITATKQTVTTIYKFIRDCKDARADLSRITGELSELTLILELIKDENASATKDCLPSALQAQVQSMLTSCTATVQQIEKNLGKCRGKPGPLRWTLIEKDKVAGWKGSLEVFKSGLSLVLETINLSVTREIRQKTEIIQDNTVEIKRDTSEILKEIYKLRNQLPPGLQSDPDQVRLEQWLDNLTHYAETVVADQASHEVSETDSIFECAEEQQKSNNSPTTPKQPHLATSRRTHTPTFSDEDSSESGADSSVISRAQSLEINQPAPVSKKTRDSHEPLIYSSPCNSELIGALYCAAIQTWATLHEDLVLRLWSSRTGELRASLPILRANNGEPYTNGHRLKLTDVSLCFCDAKPAIILVDLRCSSLLEVWNWDLGVRVHVAREMSDKRVRSWTCFIPRSTILYSHNTSDISLLDLAAPSHVRKASLAAIIRKSYNSLESRGYKVHGVRFVSENEIFIMWTRAIPSNNSSSRVKKSPQPARLWKCYLIDLPSVIANQSTSRVDAICNDTVARSSKVTARYVIPQDFTSINKLEADSINRTLTVSGNIPSHQEDLEKDGRGECKKILVLNLDTGATLYQVDEGWCDVVHALKYVIMDFPAEDCIIARSLEDGRELGRIPRRWWWRALTSSNVALMRQRNSNMEFSSWTIFPDETGRTAS